jgi:hypothetical protein
LQALERTWIFRNSEPSTVSDSLRRKDEILPSKWLVSYSRSPMISNTSVMLWRREKSLVQTSFCGGHHPCLVDQENDEFRTEDDNIQAKGRAPNRSSIKA